METAVAKAEMLIRKPVEKVFDAFVNPEITTRFWFTRSSALLEEGKTVRWDWELFGVSAQVLVCSVEQNRRIVIEWPGQGTANTVEWLFTGREGGHTVVSIRETGFDLAAGNVIEQVADSSAGFSLVLAGAKAYLEHGLELNLVADRFPDRAPCQTAAANAIHWAT